MKIDSSFCKCAIASHKLGIPPANIHVFATLFATLKLLLFFPSVLQFDCLDRIAWGAIQIISSEGPIGFGTFCQVWQFLSTDVPSIELHLQFLGSPVTSCSQQHYFSQVSIKRITFHLTSHEKFDFFWLALCLEGSDDFQKLWEHVQYLIHKAPVLGDQPDKRILILIFPSPSSYCHLGNERKCPLPLI